MANIIAWNSDIWSSSTQSVDSLSVCIGLILLVLDGGCIYIALSLRLGECCRFEHQFFALLRCRLPKQIVDSFLDIPFVVLLIRINLWRTVLLKFTLILLNWSKSVIDDIDFNHRLVFVRALDLTHSPGRSVLWVYASVEHWNFTLTVGLNERIQVACFQLRLNKRLPEVMTVFVKRQDASIHVYTDANHTAFDKVPKLRNVLVEVIVALPSLVAKLVSSIAVHGPHLSSLR